MIVDYLIIGGGIIGQAVAWELSQRVAGKNILLLDKSQPSQATTSQAAALVTQGRDKEVASALVKDTLSSIQYLNEINEQPIPFNQVGGLHIAFTDSEYLSLTKMARVAKRLNISHEWLTAEACQKLCPSFQVMDAMCGLYFKEDGFVDGATLADYYGRAARAQGVTMLPGHEVSSILPILEGYRVDVKEKAKTFNAKHVVICAGPWAASLLDSLSIPLPVTSVRSLYWLTETCLEKSHSLPVCIVPSVQGYFRPEIDSILFGIRDKGAALHPNNIPDDVHGFEFSNAKDGMSVLHDNWQSLVKFWPALERLGLTTEVTGISSYSPDGLPVIGASEQYQHLTIVSGCSGAGIAYSGGIAKQVANHILDNTVSLELNINRFKQGDAYDAAFRQRCLLARSEKKAG